MLTIIIIAGFLTGITTILFGFGGGFVTVPLIYHVLNSTESVSNDSIHIAVATSTSVMIANSTYATIRNYRAGNLAKPAIFPLFYFIGLGAIFGVFLATLLQDNIIKNIFIIYMIITIIDCLWRKGFIENKNEITPLSHTTLIIGGPTIGMIASLLGVGGSVMTVPLLRRKGYEMKYCASAANPLSIPVAIMGTIFYAWWGIDKNFGEYYVGYINLKFLVLLIGSGFVGILFAQHFIPKINDNLHAKIYVCLLFLVLIAISL